MHNFESDNDGLNNLNEEEISFLVFKYLRSLQSYKNEKIIIDSLINARKYKTSKEIILDTRRIYSEEFYEEYNNILDKWVKLAKELSLTTSVELSILFTYLLWNGYFSDSFTHYYNSIDRKNIAGLFHLDIFNGVGVCLNYCDMLKDFLVKNNIDSAILNSYIIDFKRNNRANELIQRNNTKESSFDKIISKLFNFVIKKNGNHAFLLINDNNKIYIYDPTNLFFAKVINSKTASLIDGIGKVELKPYQSYELSITDKEIMTLDKLFDKKYYDTELSKDNLIKNWLDNISLLDSNSFLLKECYKETIPTIINISKKLKRIK